MNEIIDQREQRANFVDNLLLWVTFTAFTQKQSLPLGLSLSDSKFSKVTEHNDWVKNDGLFKQIDLGFGFEKRLLSKTYLCF